MAEVYNEDVMNNVQQEKIKKDCYLVIFKNLVMKSILCCTYMCKKRKVLPNKDRRLLSPDA